MVAELMETQRVFGLLLADSNSFTQVGTVPLPLPLRWRLMLLRYLEFGFLWLCWG